MTHRRMPAAWTPRATAIILASMGLRAEAGRGDRGLFVTQAEVESPEGLASIAGKLNGAQENLDHALCVSETAQ